MGHLKSIHAEQKHLKHSWFKLRRLRFHTALDSVVSFNEKLGDLFIHSVAVDIDSLTDSVSGLLNITSDDLVL